MIFNDYGYCFCEAKETPNDIFESDNVIITFGKSLIEIFYYSQNNNNNQTNNDNNNNNNNLVKKYEIPINNNNNNNNNNDDNKNEILCYQLYKNFIICGHRSGIISTWKPTNEMKLENSGKTQVTQCAINKILSTKLSDNKDYLYLACADGTIKVYSLDSNSIAATSQKFEQEIDDIKMVNDFDKKKNIIISLKNGEIKVMDLELQFLFDIPSRFYTKKIRQIISLQKPQNNNDNTKGDLLLITEGNNLDIFTWIKKGSFKVINPHNNNPHNNPHNNMQMQYQQPPHYPQQNFGFQQYQ